MSNQDYDIAIIGAGPGGYVAAIRAAQLGLKTAIIEREHLGGICLNWGCIPTKALLRSAEIIHLARRGKEFGFTIKDLEIDLKKIVKRSRTVSRRLSNGVAYLLKKNKVTVIDGEARLKAAGVIGVVKDGKALADVRARHIILATGARARSFAHLQPDGEKIWTYKQALVPEDLPKSLLVIGSGAIGIEFASFYTALGVDVTVAEIMDQVLPVEDAEIAAIARKGFERQGMQILTGASVEKLETSGAGVSASIKLKDGKMQQLTCDRVILAVGITPNTENLGLEELGVKTDRGHVVTDEWCKTSVDGIYAIGDITAPPWLAHKASHEAILCVEKIAGEKHVHPLDAAKIPGCTYCTPQIASVGLTEEKARAQGREIRVGRFPFQANGKAIALGEPDGMVKTIFDARTGELIGAHMVGAEVTELIQGYAVAMSGELTEAELMATVFPHPTLSEMMHESVLDAYGRVIHT